MVVAGSAAVAQTTADAKKAIDVEQFQKAKELLNGLIKAQPAVGENYFQLGQAYLETDKVDSAKLTFSNGVAASPQYLLNYVGLGAVDLEKGDVSSAKANFDKAAASANKKDIKPLVYIGKAYTSATKPDYKSALAYLEKGKLLNPKDAELWLALGNAHRGDKDNSAAYSEYSTALENDKGLLRAKLELGVSVKMAKEWQVATEKFNEVVAADPNYGPAYRELAETYYQWAKDAPLKDKDGSTKYDPAKIQLALQNYNKYMDLTDRSFESRMRHADFLFLAGEFKELEAEATAMAKIDNSNPRVFRYLGYTAFQNGNYPASVKALQDFITKVDSTRVLGSDFLYLGKAQLASKDTVTALKTLAKAVQKDSTVAEMMSEIGAGLYKGQKYTLAAEAYQLGLKAPKPKLLDAYWVGRSYYFDASVKIAKDSVAAKQSLVKADSAFSYFSRKYPDVADGYLYRARIARQFDSETAPKGLSLPYFEKFIQLWETKGLDKATVQNKREIVEAYNNAAAFYAYSSDMVKAKALTEKALVVDPANAFALDLQKKIGSVAPAPAPNPK